MARNGTVAYVTRLPDCDLCGMDARTEKRLGRAVEVRRARYDLKTKQGPWAFVCEDHRKTHAASETLGTGLGQELVVRRSVQA